MKETYRAPIVTVASLRKSDIVLLSGFDPPITDDPEANWGDLFPLEPNN